MSNLTESQKKAVFFGCNNNVKNEKMHLIIEAGAGAGKTKVLSERVKWLTTAAPKEYRLNSSELFLVTFTNDAQEELKERVNLVLKNTFLENNAQLIHISTIDSLFDSLVDGLYPMWWENYQKHNKIAQIPPILRLVSESEVQRNLEKKVLQYFNENSINSMDLSKIIDFMLSGGFKKNNSLVTFSNNTFDNLLKCMCLDTFLCASNESIRIASQKIHPATPNLISKIHKLARFEYENRILRGEFTYSDKTVFLKDNLNKNTLIHIKELIVDEYQDTNYLQHQILWQLVDNCSARMVVVGDPKQSIYGFRGASVDVFKSITINPLWEHIVLNENFRTQASLLSEINALSKIAFRWENPNYTSDYKNSVFYKQAQQKYICDNALIAGNKTHQECKNNSVYIVSSFIPQKLKQKLKINELTPFAYGHFLQKYQSENNIKWSDIVVLCEKNKQIKTIQDAFKKLGIPITTSAQKAFDNVVPLEFHVFHALIKCLASRAQLFDFYLIWTSPLCPISENEIQNYFTLAASNSHKIIDPKNFENLLETHAFFTLIKKYQSFAHSNFFLAFQTLRWELCEKLNLNLNAQIFCMMFDVFAKDLYVELLNPNIRYQLEDCIVNDTATFPIAPTLGMDNIQSPTQLELNSGDALEIKTVHKAKGLEWPVVCFFPKYGQSVSSGEFIVNQSELFLDISWLSADVEGLSVLQRIDNPLFPFQDSSLDEKKKLLRFAQLRKQQEENYERQRVFYTAFTRPKETLFLFQPVTHHSRKKGLKDLVLEQKKEIKSDYLEQDVYVSYVKDNFYFQEENLNSTSIVENFVSHNHQVHLANYNLELLNNSLNLDVQNEQIKETSSSIDFLNGQTEKWFEKSLNGQKSEIAQNELPSIPTWDEGDFKKHLSQIRSQRQKIQKGLIFHSGMEIQNKTQNSFLTDLEKNSVAVQREMEIWSYQNALSNRVVLDLFFLIDTKCFLRVCENYHCKSVFQEQNLGDVLALVVDYKTGKEQTGHIDQIQNYIKIIGNLLENESTNLIPLNFKVDTGKKITVMGILDYSNFKETELLNLVHIFPIPFLKFKEEKFYHFVKSK